MSTINRPDNFSNIVHGLKDANKGKAFGQAVSEAAHSKNQDISPDKVEEVTAKSIKQELDSSILKATLNVSVSAGNEPLSLLLKTAIEGINEVLEPELGANAIQNAYDSELDVSPKATAERIVSLSTAFFSSYQKQNPELSDQEAATKFAEIIGGGIDTGFSEAREILDGLSVLEGDIASNIDATYDLVQQGLKAFVDSFVEMDEEKTNEEPST